MVKAVFNVTKFTKSMLDNCIKVVRLNLTNLTSGYGPEPNQHPIRNYGDSLHKIPSYTTATIVIATSYNIYTNWLCDH